MSFIDDRLKICSTCPERSPGQMFTTCRACGCVLELKVLSPWARCPEQRWNVHADPADPDYAELLLSDWYHLRFMPEARPDYRNTLELELERCFGPAADLEALWQQVQQRRERT